MVLQGVPPTREVYRYVAAESWEFNKDFSNIIVDYGVRNYVHGVPNVGNGEACSAKALSINADSSGSENMSPETQTTNSQEQRTSAISSREEKKRAFESYVSIVLSCTYAVFLVTLGIVIYVADILTVNSSLAAAYNLYLAIVGLIYLTYLFIDIRRYVCKAKDHLRSITSIDKEDGSSTTELNLGNDPSTSHCFCFALGRHAGSFYLKVGAAVFCFGHLTHCGLLLVYEIVFLTSEEFYECFSPVALLFDAIYPVYSFLLLFFVYKYSNVIINRQNEAARILIMHTIASSLCFWIWAIIRESTDSLTRHANAADKGLHREHFREAELALPSQGFSPLALPLTSYQQRGAQDLLEFLNSSYLDEACQHTELDVIYEWFSPYLYPFTIEYSILVVGILYVIWNNIGNCDGDPSEGVPCPPLVGPEAGSNVVLHADCTHSSRGLFGGLLMLVGSIVSIIVFFIVVADRRYAEFAEFANQVTVLTLLTVMTLSVTLAYKKIVKLDVNRNSVSLLDDILLFLAIPAFFLYAIFSVVPAIQRHDYLKITIIILEVSQVLIQTPLIIDGLRRCSNSQKLRIEKPGRELLTFLITCNIALWIIQTFEIKSTDTTDYRYDFYGRVLWTILKHMTVPLTMFYRFHSSVCLVDIWKSAYQPRDVHR